MAPRRGGRAEVGPSGCARRSATVRQFQRETLDSRTVAHSRACSRQGPTGMAFKRSWVRLPSAPLLRFHMLSARSTQPPPGRLLRHGFDNGTKLLHASTVKSEPSGLNTGTSHAGSMMPVDGSM